MMSLLRLRRVTGNPLVRLSFVGLRNVIWVIARRCHHSGSGGCFVVVVVLLRLVPQQP